MSDPVSNAVQRFAGTMVDPAVPSRFDSATAELLMALRLSGQAQTIGSSDATKRYAATDPAVALPTNRFSS
jgi:hypothetical protein